MAAAIMAEMLSPEGAAMHHVRILVCRVDARNPDHLTELAAIDLPPMEPAALAKASTLDTLEATTIEVGHTVLRAALQAQWEAIDAHLVDAYRRRFPADQLLRDGHRTITIASRLGTLQLPRQVLTHRESGMHVLPGDAALPTHSGMIITRTLQEWACLLTQDLPFATAARLLGWQTQEEQILSPTTMRTLVRRHGALVRVAEQEPVAASAHRADRDTPVPLVSHATPRRRAGWPAALSSAVEAALAHERPCPPRGIAWADWAWVLDVRRSDPGRTAADLRFLGPAVEARQVWLSWTKYSRRPLCGANSSNCAPRISPRKKAIAT
jgi:hypothetical protein